MAGQIVALVSSFNDVSDNSLRPTTKDKTAMTTDPAPNALHARYGAPATAGGRRRTVILLVVLGILATAGAIAIAWWATSDDVPAREISVRKIDEFQREVTFTVQLPQGRSAVCMVESFNDMFGQVGAVSVDVGPTTDGEPLLVSAVVTSAEPATAARLRGCTYASN